MGVSTDAIVAYGIDLGEDYRDALPWWGEIDEDGYSYGDQEDWICKQVGLGYDHIEKFGDDKKDYYRQRRETIAAYPVEEVRHCSGDYPMIFLAVRGSVTMAYRGSPKILHLPEISRLPAFIPYADKLKEWDLDPYQSDWHLMSYYSY